ncbi:diacylglycerol/lipid kinase family protein [Fredinandcohnia humi]
MNKVSGYGRALKIWQHIESILQEKNIIYCVHNTQKAKHATEIVKQLVSNKETKVIVAVGGDGTVHEVINGLVGSDIPLGIIPAGSGNDFCRGLGIPLRFDKALDRILKHEVNIIDIGCVNAKYFATVVGIGFDGKVAEATNSSKYKIFLNFVRLGSISYLVGVLKVLVNYKPTYVELDIDSMQLKIPKLWLVAVANSTFYAGGMAICPGAKNNDGLFDICVVQDMSRWQLLRILPTVFKGRHIQHPSIKIFRGKEIEILSETPLIVHGDGEIIGETPVKLKIKPNLLYVV